MTPTFSLLTGLPLEFKWAGRYFRLQIEVESVSREARLLALDLRASFYTAWLLATGSSREALGSRLKAGFEPKGRSGKAMLVHLIREGRAREI